MKKMTMLLSLFGCTLVATAIYSKYFAPSDNVLQRLRKMQSRGGVLVKELATVANTCPDKRFFDTISTPPDSSYLVLTDLPISKAQAGISKDVDVLKFTESTEYEKSPIDIIPNYAASLSCKKIAWATRGTPPKNAIVKDWSSVSPSNNPFLQTPRILKGQRLPEVRAFISDIDGSNIREIWPGITGGNASDTAINGINIITEEGDNIISLDVGYYSDRSLNHRHPWWSKGFIASNLDTREVLASSDQAVLAINPTTFESVSVPIDDINKPEFQEIIDYLQVPDEQRPSH